MPNVQRSDGIYVSGHTGLLGQAVVRRLTSEGYTNIITCPHSELDLRDQAATYRFLETMKPKAVIHCAALVGGIHANSSRPAEFLFDNLAMQANIIQGAHLNGVQHLIYFGSNCMYPVAAPQPMAENLLLSGPMEPTNIAYGAAKAAGMVQVESYTKQYGRNYMCVIPAGLYGPHDNYDLAQCHVTPALLLRFHVAKKEGQPSFSVWGTGKPRRELLYVDDAARGIQLLLENYSAKDGPINLGAGNDLSVREMAEAIQSVVGFKGELTFDLSKPDGNPRKLLDSSKIQKLGFEATTSVRDGLQKTYDWLLSAPFVRGVKPGTL